MNLAGGTDTDYFTIKSVLIHWLFNGVVLIK